MKMPEPTMPPITIMVASSSPSRRARPAIRPILPVRCLGSKSGRCCGSPSGFGFHHIAVRHWDPRDVTAAVQPGNGEIAESASNYTFAIEGIAAIQHDGMAHFPSELFPMQVPINRPFGGENQRVTVRGNLLWRLAADHSQVAMLAPEPIHGHWIVGLDLASALNQFTGDLNRGCVAQVVGIRLKREAQNSHRPAFENFQLR